MIHVSITIKKIASRSRSGARLYIRVPANSSFVSIRNDSYLIRYHP